MCRAVAVTLSLELGCIVMLAILLTTTLVLARPGHSTTSDISAQAEENIGDHATGNTEEAVKVMCSCSDLCYYSPCVVASKPCS